MSNQEEGRTVDPVFEQFVQTQLANQSTQAAKAEEVVETEVVQAGKPEETVVADPPKKGQEGERESKVFDFKEFARKAELEAEDENGFLSVVKDLREKAKKAEENPFADEFVSKLNDFVKKGGKREDFIRTQTLDLNKLKAENPDEILFHAMKLEKGDVLTDSQIRKLVENKFKTDAERWDISEDEAEVAQAEKALAVAEAYQKLTEWQIKESVPEAERLRQSEEQRAEKLANEYLKASKSVAKEFTEITLPDGRVHKVAWTTADGKPHESVANVRKAIDSPFDWIAEKLLSPDGYPDPKKIAQIQYILDNHPRMAEAKAKDTEAKVKKEMLDKIENAQTTERRPGNEAHKTGEKDVRELGKMLFGY